MFHVYRSNRPERLADALAELFEANPLSSPFEREWICVQSRGMDVWLAMQLADRLGVHANVESLFPRTLIERLLYSVHDLDPKSTWAFDEERLTFALLAALPVVLERPELQELASYLARDERGARLPQLAGRIATVFDRYSVFRPDLLRSFETGAVPGWQPVVWNALPAELRGASIASLSTQLSARRGKRSPSPARVSLFGVSSLPPLFTQILAELAQDIEVHLFVSSPSQEYWADTRPGGVGRPPGREVGHPLLGSLGRLSRDFQDVLESEVVYRESETSLFVDPGHESLLSTLQSDILHLRHRHLGNFVAPRAHIDPTDRSISIHDCHGPLREVEVLREELLDALERDPTLEPEDIIVLTPDLETYGPLVEAAFGRGSDGQLDLPFRVSEQPLRHASSVNDAFASLLALAKKRCTSVEVLDFAGLEPVRRRFGLEPEDLSLVATWVEESGIRFGRDEEHRARLEQPEERRNTWAFGLDRLLLGYAFPARDERLFAGVLPYDEIEGSSARVLGLFAELCDRLFRALGQMARSHDLETWSVLLNSLLDSLIDAEGDNAAPHQELRRALLDLGDRAREAEVTATFSLDAVEALLSPHIVNAIAAHGFLAGGITVSELLPLRGIPFRLIALLGMSDGVFPRRPTPVSFDLVASSPRKGDRSVRDEDLQLFLETLLSAREKLLITYSGQSPSDPSRFPPSVVVGSLLDTIAEGFVPASATNANPMEARRLVEERLVVRHPLQAHDPRYFSPPAGENLSDRLVSFDARRAEDAAALLAPKAPRPVFVTGPLPSLGGTGDEEPRVLRLDDLTGYFVHPARSFVRDRLGMRLELRAQALEEREPADLDALETHQLVAEVTDDLLKGRPTTAIESALRARGALPHGAMGELVLRDLVDRRARPLAELARALRGEAPPVSCDLDLELASVRLVGRVELGPNGGLFHFTPSRLRPKYRLVAWIRHLALLSAGGTPPEGAEAVVLGRGDELGRASFLRFGVPEDPRALLEHLVALHRRGQHVPLPLFPQAAFAYASRLVKSPEERDHARRDAEAAWYGGGYTAHEARGERDDLFVARLFGDAEPLSASSGEFSFEALALDVFRPMIELTTEEER